MKPDWRRLALGFLKFFGTPLCIASVLALAVAITRAREGRFEAAALALMIAIACGAAGFGLIWWVRAAARAVEPSEQLRGANPNAPWRWREDWSAGGVRTTARIDARRFLLFACIWCAATFPVMFVAPHRAIVYRDYPALLALVFPVAGIAMLAWAMRLRSRSRKYGESRFAMSSVPGQIGGSLVGAIHLEKPPDAGRAVALELACVNRTKRGWGHSLTTWDWVLWRAQQNSICNSAGEIAVAFYVPPDCRPTDDSIASSRIVWRLRAHAAGPAGGYSAEFEVPVFKIVASATPASF